MRKCRLFCIYSAVLVFIVFLLCTFDPIHEYIGTYNHVNILILSLGLSMIYLILDAIEKDLK